MQNERQKICKKISKLLSLTLRHQPEVLGIELDSQGWTPTETLIEAVNKYGIRLDMNLLEEVVRKNDKQRFAFNEDRSQIRANQGHSLNIDLKLSPSQPPEVLYHGTVEQFLNRIKSSGLLKMSRQHVHLSLDIETATKVGSRRGKPIILTIAAQRMFKAGHLFYISENGVWLTDHVPVEYIHFPKTH